MLAGRRCVHQQWHGELLIVHHHRQHSLLWVWRRCVHQQWHGELLIMHHHGQQSSLLVAWRRCPCLFRHRHNDVLLDHRQHSFWIGACSCSKLPITPMEKMLTRLLALILACATATDASVNFSRYVPHRPSKVPIAPMGFSHILRVCLQGGGVFVNSGTVTFSSCTITGNSAQSVRAHAQKFPSPRWDFHMLCAYARRAAVSLFGVAR